MTHDRGGTKSGGDLRLPRLRPELELIEGAPSVTGEPRWLIRDPLQNKFVQIDRATYEILSVWKDCPTQNALLARLISDKRVTPEPASIEHLVTFLARNNLFDHSESGAWRSLDRLQRSTRRSWLSEIVHKYLFFKVPLVEPQSYLESTLPVARRLATRRVAHSLGLCGLTGLYLVSRQWDEFVASAVAAVSWEGALLTMLSLLLVKAVHELGHGYAAVHFGCRVPTMGVAFMLMAPLLYTDVSDAWRLKDRRQRMVIGAAGVLVELAIAAVAVLAWSLLPSGGLRNVAFVLAAVSLVTSVVINLNPLMRFDGYHLLADWLGVENLHDRSFALAQWTLREWLFAIGADCPDDLPKGHRTILIIVGWATWVYRGFLFVGIALMVYHYFFKALGLVLFAVEIGYFIIRPLWGELVAWVALRRAIVRSRRAWLSAAMIFGLLLLAIVPWSTRVSVATVLEPAELARIFPSRAGRVAAIHVVPGQHIASGSALVTLESREIAHELETARIKLRLARLQHARRAADAIDKEVTLELEQSIVSLVTRIEGLEREAAELTVRAPIAGRVVELNSELVPGMWVGARELIALIADEGRWMARGYVSEADSWRIVPGNLGSFISESSERASVQVIVKEVSPGSVGQIEILDLASVHGGRILVAVDERRRMVPAIAHYPIVLDVPAAIASPAIVQRGTATILGKPESFLSSLWRNVAIVVLREGGF